MDAIFNRTSVRKYTDEKVTPEQIEMLMKAAMAAPSACNAQPWEFVVVQDREMLNKITQVHPYSFMLKEAPLAIVVCADKNKKPSLVPDFDLFPQDCSAATENIMLQATDMGLGTVWMGVYPMESMIEALSGLFELPENIVPFSMIAVGHPRGETVPKDKFDKSRIHFEKW